LRVKKFRRDFDSKTFASAFLPKEENNILVQTQCVEKETDPNFSKFVLLGRPVDISAYCKKKRVIIKEN